LKQGLSAPVFFYDCAMFPNLASYFLTALIFVLFVLFHTHPPLPAEDCDNGDDSEKKA
jgi:hypothetical protein